MGDVHSKIVRSYNMSRVKSKNTGPELMVRNYLFKNGLRYRLNVNTLPGKPDIVLKRYKTAVFVHGCFWHGHDNCKYSILPTTRIEFWRNKIEDNKKRDTNNIKQLERNGWRVIVVYSCELRASNRASTLLSILNNIKSDL